MNFIESFIEYTKDAESPTSYFKWCAYTAIAAVLRDNVFLKTNYGQVYPNIYTVIVSGKSSITRKSIPMNNILGLVRHVDNTKIIKGYTSTAGVFDVLAEQRTNVKKQLIKGGSALIFSFELTGMFFKDETLISKLTDWYDFHAFDDSNLRGSGYKSATNVCVSMLATTNDELARKMYGNSEAQKGGLLARTFLIREEKRRHIKGPFRPREATGNIKSLRKSLVDISNLRGEFRVSEDAKTELNHWSESIVDEKVSDTGVEGRLPTHVMKLAMVMSAAERPDLVITKDHIIQCIDECNKILKNYKLIVTGAGRTLVAEPGQALITELYRQPKYKLSRRQIMQRLLGNVSATELNEVLDIYQTAGYIKLTQGYGNDIQVQLTDELIKRIEEQVEVRKQTT